MGSLYAKTVLVAEDEVFMRRVVGIALERLGATVVSCENGQSALAALGAPQRIDIALLDILMPEMHGLHVLKQIRAGITRQDYEMPVALLTATQDEGCVRYAAALSCDGFILKPITQNTLSTRLEQILHKRMKLPYKPSHYGSVDVGPPDKPPTMKTPAVLGVEDLMVGMVFTKPVIAQSKVIVPSGTEVTHELLELLRNLDRVRPLGAIDAEAR